jgi:hypothetical protein
MAIVKDLWTTPFRAGQAPLWTCSSCQSGTLYLEKESLASAQTAESRAFEHGDYDDIRLRFSAFFKCSNSECQEPYSVSGGGHLEIEPSGDDSSYEYVEYHRVEFFAPGPLVFRIPEECPLEVRYQILRAFSLFLGDPASAGNKTRLAVERILDNYKIPKSARKKNGKLRYLSLQERLDRFQAKKPKDSERLRAIKWLGNIGSHTNALSRDDLFDAFEILSLVLDELYGARTVRVDAIAKQINKKKGKRS